MEILALCGPSGVGKSSIIRELVKEGRFDYPTPYTDRKLREGETDKVSLTKEEFDEMQRRGEFCVVNYLYGHHYGTSSTLIDRIVSRDRVAILDFPFDQLDKLSDWKTQHICLIPPSEEELKLRLRGCGRVERIPQAVSQLGGRYENILTSDRLDDTIGKIKCFNLTRKSLELPKANYHHEPDCGISFLIRKLRAMRNT